MLRLVLSVVPWLFYFLEGVREGCEASQKSSLSREETGFVCKVS